MAPAAPKVPRFPASCIHADASARVAMTGLMTSGAKGKRSERRGTESTRAGQRGAAVRAAKRYMRIYEDTPHETPDTLETR